MNIERKRIILGSGCLDLDKNSQRGVVFNGKNYWFQEPLFDGAGRRPPVFPGATPLEIRPVCHEVPDLTRKHLTVLRREFNSLKKDCRNQSPSALCKRFWPEKDGVPNEYYLGLAEQFRQQYLGWTFDKFKAEMGNSICWDRFGTNELADQLGYLWHWPTTGTRHKIHGATMEGVVPHSVGDDLAWRIAEGDPARIDQSQQLVRRANWVAIYDEFLGSRVYLAGLLIRDPERKAACGCSHLLRAKRLSGAKRFAFAGHEKEFAEILAYGKRRQNSKDNNGKRMPVSRVIDRMRQWGKVKFPDLGQLINNLADSTWRNYLDAKTGVKARKSPRA